MANLAGILAFISTASAAVFTPQSISFGALSNSRSFASDARQLLSDALSDSGIIQLKNIPHFAALRKQVLASAHTCLLDDSVGVSHTFEDGTIRRTIASRTVTGPGGAQPFADAKSSHCDRFNAVSDKFRAVADEAVRTFTTRLTSMLDTNVPLLTTPMGYAFITLADVVDAAEQLEHFHAYSKPSSPAGSTTSTLDPHTDQGLFIAFAPGMLVGSDASPSSTAADVADFTVVLSDKTKANVAFDEDSLAIMLGQAMENVVVPRLRDGSFRPRAAPHALRMKPTATGEARLWYGRMVLPPSTALIGNSEETYGEARDAVMQAAKASPRSTRPLLTPSIGCGFHAEQDDKASAGMHHLEPHAARVLSTESTCAEGSLLCWHHCMDQADFDATDAQCAAQNLQVQCVNSRDQLWTGTHGDYFPSCTNTTEEEATVPKFDEYPRDTTCAAGFEVFASTEGYASSVDLAGPCADGIGTGCLVARFMWNVVNGEIEAKLAFDGLFGWLSVGLDNDGGGGHEGMSGAHVLMALPGSPRTYTPEFGLDINGTEPSVTEHIISTNGLSAFRHWYEPYTPSALSAAGYEATDCHTAMSFSTSSISGWPINITGTSRLLWAANGEDSYVGYHGENRDHFTVEWAKTDIAPPTPPISCCDSKCGAASDDDNEDDDDDGVSAGAAAGIGVGAFFVGLLIGVLALVFIGKRKSAAAKSKQARTTEFAVKTSPI